jgi:SAM-dependent methyltransferase
VTPDDPFTPRSRRLRRLRVPAWLGTARRTTPFSDRWGLDRGTPIDRHYIDAFLTRHRADVRGRVLEVGDARYTERFGSEIIARDVLDVDPTNANATLLADLADTDSFEQDSYDCFVLVQTLQYVFDVAAAIRSTRRLLRPGGVALVTVPSVTKVAASAGVEGDYWRFTTASCKRLFAAEFGEEAVDVSSHGNMLVAVAFLLGMAREELKDDELGFVDPWHPVLVTARAVKRR